MIFVLWWMPREDAPWRKRGKSRRSSPPTWSVIAELAGADEDRTLARLRALRSDLIDPTIALHHGRIFKLTGDGALVELRSVVDAVRCAVEIQSIDAPRTRAPRTARRRIGDSPCSPRRRDRVGAIFAAPPADDGATCRTSARRWVRGSPCPAVAILLRKKARDWRLLTGSETVDVIIPCRPHFRAACQQAGQSNSLTITFRIDPAQPHFWAGFLFECPSGCASHRELRAVVLLL